jgi:tRNA threonylcarbamoyladenosine biosynthesis protein TsaE
VEVASGVRFLEERTLTCHSLSDRETVELGRTLGSLLGEGDVLALVGDLGCGKTWFTKGLALGLGVPPDIVVTSPSFSLVNEYTGRCVFIHIDAYRIGSVSEFLAAGLEEYFFQDAVVAVEWADRWPELLPDHRLWIRFRITGDTSRELTLKGHHVRAVSILDRFEKRLHRG